MHSFEEVNAKINRLKREGGVGYTTIGYVPMIETKVEIAANSVPSRAQVEGLGAYPWTKGEKVRVIWDGATYERETVPVNETSPWLYVGNFPKTQNKGDTGEPFCIMVSANYTFGQVYDFEDNAVTRTHTLEVEHFAETIHPISDKYLPEGFGGGSVATIDLAQYADKNFYGQSIANELLSMVAQSLGASGALQTKTAAFNDSSLFDALSTTQQVVASLDMGDDTILRFNPVASCLGGGKAQLYSFSALMMQGYTVYELKALFFFTDNTGTEMEIHVQAKPVA